MLKIGTFSKLSRISIRMLRHYDEMGLLHPFQTDPVTGYRYYAENQLPLAGRIAAFKEMGYSLASIRELLILCDDKDAVEASLLARRAELEAEAQQTAARLRLLDTALMRLRKDEIMKYDVTVKTFPERYAATVRAILPSYNHEGMLWDTLMRETAGLGLMPGDPCYCCAVFHDMEFKEADTDVEVYMTLKGSYPDTEHVRFRMLPAVTAACATFQGPYELCDEVMAAVAQWVSDNGYELDGPTFNIYHVSPHETSNPDEYVTEVYYPVRKR